MTYAQELQAAKESLNAEEARVQSELQLSASEQQSQVIPLSLSLALAVVNALLAGNILFSWSKRRGSAR